MNDSNAPSTAAATANDETTTNKTKSRKRPTSSSAAPARSRRAHSATKGAAKAPVARRGTKTAKILALLERPEGASIAELKKATGWQTHSLRGFLSGALKKKMGLKIHSGKRDNGDRVYRVRSK